MLVEPFDTTRKGFCLKGLLKSNEKKIIVKLEEKEQVPKTRSTKPYIESNRHALKNNKEHKKDPTSLIERPKESPV